MREKSIDEITEELDAIHCELAENESNLNAWIESNSNRQVLYEQIKAHWQTLNDFLHEADKDSLEHTDQAIHLGESAKQAEFQLQGYEEKANYYARLANQTRQQQTTLQAQSAFMWTQKQKDNQCHGRLEQKIAELKPSMEAACNAYDESFKQEKIWSRKVKKLKRKLTIKIDQKNTLVKKFIDVNGFSIVTPK